MVAGWTAVSRQEESAEGEAWDGATWVDVGDDGRWHPSAAERTRAFVLLGALLGILLLAAAIASIGGDDDEEPVLAPATTTTTEPEQEETTTTTQALPSSLDGEQPPEPCLDDNRGAKPLRERGEVSVLVLNGARVNGLASATAADLQDQGYITSSGDAPETEATSIIFGEGYCAEAVTLAQDLGVPSVEPAIGEPTEGRHLEVILGKDEFLD